MGLKLGSAWTPFNLGVCFVPALWRPIEFINCLRVVRNLLGRVEGAGATQGKAPSGPITSVKLYAQVQPCLGGLLGSLGSRDPTLFAEQWVTASGNKRQRRSSSKWGRSEPRSLSASCPMLLAWFESRSVQMRTPHTWRHIQGNGVHLASCLHENLKGVHNPHNSPQFDEMFH